MEQGDWTGIKWQFFSVYFKCMVARFWLMKTTEAVVRTAKKMRESTICTHQTNSSEVREAKSCCFLLWICEEQALGFPLLFVAPLTSPGSLQHITPSSCAELLLREGNPRALGRRGRGSPGQGRAAWPGWLQSLRRWKDPWVGSKPCVPQSTVDFKPEFVSRFPLCPGMTVFHLPD